MSQYTGTTRDSQVNMKWETWKCNSDYEQDLHALSQLIFIWHVLFSDCHCNQRPLRQQILYGNRFRVCGNHNLEYSDRSITHSSVLKAVCYTKKLSECDVILKTITTMTLCVRLEKKLVWSMIWEWMDSRKKRSVSSEWGGENEWTGVGMRWNESEVRVRSPIHRQVVYVFVESWEDQNVGTDMEVFLDSSSRSGHYSLPIIPRSIVTIIPIVEWRNQVSQNILSSLFHHGFHCQEVGKWSCFHTILTQVETGKETFYHQTGNQTTCLECNLNR